MDEELRSEVERQLGEDHDLEFSGEVWAVVKANAYYGNWVEVFAGDSPGDDPDKVVDQALGAYLQALAPRRRTSKGEKRTPPQDPRFSALAEVLALEADREEQVQRFRSTVLRGKLVAPEKLEAWLRRRAKNDGPSTRWVRVPRGENGEPVGMAEARQSRYSLQADLLRVARGQGQTDILRPVTAGGTLDHLRTVAIGLGRSTGWSEGWASRFVLTGETPPPPADVRYQVTLRSVSSSGTDATSRVDLSVSPFVSPAELARAFGQLRREWFGFERVKKLEPKAAALAVHWAKTEGMPTEQRREEWNRSQPREWRYLGGRSNFGRDAREAYKNVTLREQGSGE